MGFIWRKTYSPPSDWNSVPLYQYSFYWLTILIRFYMELSMPLLQYHVSLKPRAHVAAMVTAGPVVPPAFNALSSILSRFCWDIKLFRFTTCRRGSNSTTCDRGLRSWGKIKPTTIGSYRYFTLNGSSSTNQSYSTWRQWRWPSNLKGALLRLSFNSDPLACVNIMLRHFEIWAFFSHCRYY